MSAAGGLETGVRLFESRSPGHPVRVLASLREISEGKVRAAVSAVRQVQSECGGATATERVERMSRAIVVLVQASSELVELGIAEFGKPRVEMTGEVVRGVAILRYYAGAACKPDGDSLFSPDEGSLLWSRRVPIRVAGLIAPWRFLVVIPPWELLSALDYENVVVWESAPATTAVVRLLEEVLLDVLGAGVLQMHLGDAEIGAALVREADLVSLTGSSRVGGSIISTGATWRIPVQAEMGGQNAPIELPHADLERAASMVVASTMGYVGQKCRATSHVIVVNGSDCFIGVFVEVVLALKIGDFDEAAAGPVVWSLARWGVLDLAKLARQWGARVFTRVRQSSEGGYFIGPMLVGDVQPGSPQCQEEVLAPVAAVLPKRNLMEAIEFANGVCYGLVSSLFTSDLDAAMVASCQLDIGLTRVNAPISGVDFLAPSGGTVASCYGLKEQGEERVHFSTKTKTPTLSSLRRAR